MIRYSRSLVLPLFLAFIMTACGTSQEDMIIGAWEMEEGGYPMVTFNADGTFWEAIDATDESTGTWTIKDAVLNMTNDMDGAAQLSQKIEELTETKLSVIFLEQYRIVYKKRE